MINEIRPPVEILPLSQILLSVGCDALALLGNVIPLANHLFGMKPIAIIGTKRVK